MNHCHTESISPNEAQPETAWAERAEHWAGMQGRDAPKKFKSADLRKPLVLAGHGMNFRINHGALEVRNGLTHHPQKREEFRFFPRDPALPSRIIVLDGSGVITLDVLRWLCEQAVPLIQLNFRGQVVTAIGGNGISADPKLAQLQLAACQDPERTLALATFFVHQKLVQSRRVLNELPLPSSERDTAISHLNTEIERLRTPWIGAKTSLLGVEGQCARVYFDVWRALPISWQGTGKQPIPDAWRIIGPRRSRLNARAQGASHPVQAMLNYGYATAESQIRIEIAASGLDLSLGFLHDVKSDRAALVFDVLEPARPIVDQAILRFVQEEAFHPADFTLDRDGICRLNPQLARRVISSLNLSAEIRSTLEKLTERLKPPSRVVLSRQGKTGLTHTHQARRNVTLNARLIVPGSA